MADGRSLTELPDFESRPELARGRIHDFWGGVWKRFLVRGPASLTVQVNRNNSFNTILAGATLDLVDELPAPYFGEVAEQQRIYRQREGDRRGYVGEWPLSAPTLWRIRRAENEREAADRLFAALDRWALRNPAWYAAEARRLNRPLALWYGAALADAKLRQPGDLRRLATCYYQMGLHARWEETLRAAGLTPARDVEKALRWDGKTDHCSGRGNEWVKRYLAEKQAASAAKP